jgi:hypothetical protein
MGVMAKAVAGGDLVVVPHHECAEWTVHPIAVGRNDEVVARLQSAVVAMIERFSGSKLQHNCSSIADAMDRFENGYGVETIERLVSRIRTERSIW